MARKKTSPVHKYFKFNISTEKSECQIDYCGHALVGQHAKNLERHIESLHYEIFENKKKLMLDDCLILFHNIQK